MAGHWLSPGEFKEVGPIGAVSLDGDSITASYDCLVKPKINATPSDYFQNPTGITNARLKEEGVDFETGALSALQKTT